MNNNNFDDESSNLYDHLPRSKKLSEVKEKMDLNKIIKDHKTLFLEYIDSHKIYSEKRMAIIELLLKRGIDDPEAILEYIEYNDDDIKKFADEKGKFAMVSDTYKKYTRDKYLIFDVVIRFILMLGVVAVICKLTTQMIKKN